MRGRLKSPGLEAIGWIAALPMKRAAVTTLLFNHHAFSGSSRGRATSHQNLSTMRTRLKSPDLYTIGWIAALPMERAAVTALLHDRHDAPEGFKQHQSDANSYTWGRIGEHNIVIASLSAGVYGVPSAAHTASALIHSLPHIRIGLLVGIGGGVLHGLILVEISDSVTSSSASLTVRPEEWYSMTSERRKLTVFGSGKGLSTNLPQFFSTHWQVCRRSTRLHHPRYQICFRQC